MQVRITCAPKPYEDRRTECAGVGPFVRASHSGRVLHRPQGPLPDGSRYQWGPWRRSSTTELPALSSIAHAAWHLARYASCGRRSASLTIAVGVVPPPWCAALPVTSSLNSPWPPTAPCTLSTASTVWTLTTPYSLPTLQAPWTVTTPNTVSALSTLYTAQTKSAGEMPGNCGAVAWLETAIALGPPNWRGIGVINGVQLARGSPG